jgi:hypothetical protein
MNYWTYITTYKNLEINYIYNHGTQTNKGSKKTSRSGQGGSIAYTRNPLLKNALMYVHQCQPVNV